MIGTSVTVADIPVVVALSVITGTCVVIGLSVAGISVAGLSVGISVGEEEEVQSPPSQPQAALLQPESHVPSP